MQLFVIGATGRTGTEILDLALARGHRVTAFVRSPHKLTPREHLRVIKGNPHSTDELRDALPGHDAVISALGTPPREAFSPSTLLTDGAASTVAAMTAARVSRLAIVSAALLFPGGGLRYAFFRWLTRHHLRDLTTMEAVVTASELEWTVVRPPRLVRKREETYHAVRDTIPATFSTTFRAVAAFMLDAVELRRHTREIVGLSR